MQARRRLFDGKFRPQRVDDLLAVQCAARRQREKLDERGGLSAAPVCRWDGPAVDSNGEVSQ
jgi:hypothetical protein